MADLTKVLDEISASIATHNVQCLHLFQEIAKVLNQNASDNSLTETADDLTQAIHANEENIKSGSEKIDNLNLSVNPDVLTYSKDVNNYLDEFVQLFSSNMKETAAYLKNERYSGVLSYEKKALYNLLAEVNAIKQKYMTNGVGTNEVNRCAELIHTFQLINASLLGKIKTIKEERKRYVAATIAALEREQQEYTTFKSLEADSRYRVTSDDERLKPGNADENSTWSPQFTDDVDSGPSNVTYSNFYETDLQQPPAMIATAPIDVNLHSSETVPTTTTTTTTTSTTTSSVNYLVLLADDNIADNFDIANEQIIESVKEQQSYSEETAYDFYARVMTAFEEIEKSYQVILSEEYRDMRFRIKKTVIFPVNTILTSYVQLVKSKYCQILNALNSEVPQIVLRARHPELVDPAILYALDALANKFLDHAQHTITQKPGVAFSLAAIIIGLWIKYPPFGVMFLAHLMTKCPYIIPYYFPRLDGQSNDDYFKSIGYLYKGGKQETQENFLNRMGGMMRLYAAIIITPAPTGVVHPCGLEYGWTWLADILNLEPVPHITVTMVHNFLEVTGAYMNTRFGRQFQKIFQLIIEHFLPEVYQVTPYGYKAPVERFKAYVDELMRKGFSKPSGVLSGNFLS